MKQSDVQQTEKILFVNGSPNRDGNTAALAKELLEGKEYETIALTDYCINFYGQILDGDQFDEVYKKMKEADVVVMGSPVYWHNICASMRTLLERFYGPIEPGSFKGKKLFFLYQGAAPTKMMIDDGEYTMSRFAGMYGFSYEGMATNKSEAKALRSKL
ncbi:MAG: flavodoxin family protein [Phocaeicola plebeius]